MSAPVSIPRRSPRSGAGSRGTNHASSSSSSSAASSPSVAASATRDSSGSGKRSRFGGRDRVGGVSGSPLARNAQSAESSSDDGEGERGKSQRTEGTRMERKPSLMGSALAASDHTVINVGHPSGPPRLISCVRSSQGFDWNQEIFLPSYGRDFLDRDDDFGGERSRGRGGEGMMDRRHETVADIVLDDEEARGLLPE